MGSIASCCRGGGNNHPLFNSPVDSLMGGFPKFSGAKSGLDSESARMSTVFPASTTVHI